MEGAAPIPPYLIKHLMVEGGTLYESIVVWCAWRGEASTSCQKLLQKDLTGIRKVFHHLVAYNEK